MTHVSPKSRRRFLLGIGLLALLSVPAWMHGAPSASAPASAPSAGYDRAVIIPINDDMITDVTRDSLRRRVAKAREMNADLIVFELDTPGGLVSSAMDICNDIKDLSDIRTVAWVRPQALSAGAMIAVSCNEIIMAEAGQIGDCAPIMMSPVGVEEMPDTIQSKIESPILTMFRDAAHRNGYDPLLSEAMVKIGVEIYWIENTQTGKRKFVTAEDKAKLVGGDEGAGLLDGLTKLGKKEASWRLVETFPFVHPETGEPVPVQQPIVKPKALLTLTGNEAVAFGFANAIVDTVDQLRTRYGIAAAEVPVLSFDWSEKLTSWLTSPEFRGLLMVLLLMGAYMEFNTPGLGVPGAVALICLVLLLGAPYLTGLASVWEVVAVAAGIVLVAVEVFVIPGFGIAGILGVLLVMLGLLGTFVPAEPGPIHIPRLDSTWEFLQTGMTTMIGAGVVSLVGLWLLAKYLPQMPVAGRMVLDSETVQMQNRAAGAPVIDRAPVPVGSRGVTQTVLRPAGKALIDGQRVDVVTEGDMIDEGAEIEVVRVDGNRVVVRPASA